MKKILFLVIICISFFLTSAYADGLVLFASESDAQKHCPKDIVVWLNLPTGIWHYKGTQWYGRTKHGSYVCQNEAKVAGDRASLNGN